MKRRPTITKVRPADWQDGPELGRHETAWGICDLEEKGREVQTKWLVNGPAPVRMVAKRKYRPC